MLNRTKYFRKLCLSGSFLVGMIGLSSSANAQFIGINVDYAIDYSAAPGKVSGCSVGISHPAPFIPNIGYSSVSFKDKETITDSSDNTVSLETTTTIKTINLFYNVPFPVVTITVGFGYGSDNLNTGVETKTTIVETFEVLQRTKILVTWKPLCQKHFFTLDSLFGTRLSFILATT